MCIHLTPLNTIELAKPTKSPVTPPPMEMIIESLLIFLDKIKSNKIERLSKFLNLSFDLSLKKKVSDPTFVETFLNSLIKFSSNFNL